MDRNPSKQDSLVDLLLGASEEIYQRTIRSRSNWVQHSHGPTDSVEECATCHLLGITQEDWDNAEEIE